MPYSRFHSTMPSVRAKPPAANTAERLLRQTKIPMANASAAARQNTAGARPVQVCHAAHPVAEGIAVIPSLVSAGSAGLAQPGQRVPPADEQYRNAKPHHTGNDVAQCLHHNFTDGTAIQPDEIQPIPQRNGNIGSAAHIIAPRHKKPAAKGTSTAGANSRLLVSCWQKCSPSRMTSTASVKAAERIMRALLPLAAA